MRRCTLCGAFHVEEDPVEEAPWRPQRFGWYGYRHEVGLGDYAVTYTSEAQVLRVRKDTATVCVYGPVVFTTSVAFDDLTDLPGDDDGD